MPSNETLSPFCLIPPRPAVHRPALRCPLIALAASVLFAAQSHAQRDLTDIPVPDPVAELGAMNVDDQSEVNLFAADPDISKPIQMNFDASGALWIASSEVYPQIKPGEEANDKIIVLRDTDGDGRSDQRTVFADGLLIPTGVIPDGPHAAYVAESTRLLYLEDTDQDGKADKRRVVLSGFGTEDTHHLIHTLRFGPDGCLYFNQSIYIHSHIETPYGTRHLDGGGIWRYRPSTGKLEILCKGFVNPWGHVFDRVGESFVTDGAFFEGINYVFPDSVFVTSPGATRWLKGLNPGSPKHCGLEILSGTHVPPEWSGDFVANDFRSHRVCRFTVKPSGSGYISRQQPEIITTGHVAFRPIDARMGPDGALYVADWYNPIIQHGEVDFRDERRDRTHGRVWRVSFPDRPLDPWPDFSSLSVDELLKSLEDSALPVRQFARQELWKRAEKSADEVLSAYVGWSEQNPASRSLELAWFHEVVQDQMTEPAPLVAEVVDEAEASTKRTLLRSLWRRRSGLPEAQRRRFESSVLEYLGSDEPRVRLEAVVCAGQLDPAEHPDVVSKVLQATRAEMDDNLDFAVWQSLRQLDASYPQDSILTAQSWQQRHDELAYAVSAIGTPEAAEVAVALVESGKAESDSVDSLVQSIAQAGNDGQLGRAVKSLLLADRQNLSLARMKPILDRTSRDGTVPKNIGPTLAEIAADASDPKSIETLAKVAGVWKVKELEASLVRSVSETDGPLREKVILAIGAFDSKQSKETLNRLAADGDAATRVAATRAIASRRPRAAIGLISSLLKDDETGAAAAAMTVNMVGRKDMPPLLAKAIEKIELPSDLARNLLRGVQSAGGHAELEQAIRTSGELASAAWKLTPELKQELLALVKSAGSPARGRSGLSARKASMHQLSCDRQWRRSRGTESDQHRWQLPTRLHHRIVARPERKVERGLHHSDRPDRRRRSAERHRAGQERGVDAAAIGRRKRSPGANGDH